MADRTNWAAVTNFFNSVIEEAAGSPEHPFASVGVNHLEVKVYSPALGDTLCVVIPERKVDDFMKALPLFEAKVETGEI